MPRRPPFGLGESDVMGGPDSVIALQLYLDHGAKQPSMIGLEVDLEHPHLLIEKLDEALVGR